MPRELRAVRDEAIHSLAVGGVPDPAVDADLLIAHVLGVSRGRVQALLVMNSEMDAGDASRVAALVSRRAAREPLQHITGHAAFRALELEVGPGVFVPRPETEIVAQFAIDALHSVAAPEPIAVDLGTGSGALALALATEVPHAQVFAVELSPDAAAWARRNIERVGASNVTLVEADLATALPELAGSVSVVVSNPPYVPDEAIPLDPEVHLFDPEAALYGGEDGLDIVRDLSLAAQRLLYPGGTLVIEHGDRQGFDVRDILTRDGWRGAATHPDLTTRDRLTTAIR